jgi:ribosomal protein S18 acetylase RimI-like enzyme
MREHWGVLDPTLNRDLDDIATSYARGTFLVACVDDIVVATGALRPIDDGVRGEIVRMSTLAAYRRCGIARLVLSDLVAEARGRGMRSVTLTTSSDWHDAIAFYEASGMTRVDRGPGFAGAAFVLRL